MQNTLKNHFHDNLKSYMDQLVTSVYVITRKFPKEEIFGLTSQLRRASLSIILNYIEGYGRIRKTHLRNFLEMSYGSLKEVKYLLYFSHKMEYIKDK